MNDKLLDYERLRTSSSSSSYSSTPRSWLPPDPAPAFADPDPDPAAPTAEEPVFLSVTDYESPSTSRGVSPFPVHVEFDRTSFPSPRPSSAVQESDPPAQDPYTYETPLEAEEVLPSSLEDAVVAAFKSDAYRGASIAAPVASSPAYSSPTRSSPSSPSTSSSSSASPSSSAYSSSSSVP